MDQGWSGADMIITDSDEEARVYFLSDNISRIEEENRLHLKHSPKNPNPWPAQLEYWKEGKFWDDVVIYPIVKGQVIQTLGDN